ncbi:16S rRNA (cytosine(1402)-N(4))-methyltransferase RsmH [Elusimicrobiota bacterium]
MKEEMPGVNYHIPALPEETLQHLIGNPQGTYVDLTLGCGGHSELILQRYADVKVIGIDVNTQTLELAKDRLKPWGDRIILGHGNFSDISSILKELNIGQVDGFLFDLGPSSYEILDLDLGLSYQKDCDLDMRLSKKYFPVTGADFLNHQTEEELVTLLRSLADLSPGLSRKIAKAIINQRDSIKRFKTTYDLTSSIGTVTSNRKIWSRVFQALRIQVNKELENLEAMLNAAIPLLKEGGRIVGISFHSLEDRIVKVFFRQNKLDGRVKLLTKKPLGPTCGEVLRNPRARSAHLRAAVKI